MRQRLVQRCGNSYHLHSAVAMVPGAGIEPARLAAGDFESPVRFKLGVAYGAIIAASRPKNVHWSKTL
jgi:hypothetical protein